MPTIRGEGQFSTEPIARRKSDRLSFFWDGSPADRVPGDQFAVVATAEVEVPAGDYKIWTFGSDDGVRVMTDGKVAIEGWPWTANAVVPLKELKHKIRVEHREKGSEAVLVFMMRAL